MQQNRNCKDRIKIMKQLDSLGILCNNEYIKWRKEENMELDGSFDHIAIYRRDGCQLAIFKDKWVYVPVFYQ